MTTQVQVIIILQEMPEELQDRVLQDALTVEMVLHKLQRTVMKEEIMSVVPEWTFVLLFVDPIASDAAMAQ